MTFGYTEYELREISQEIVEANLAKFTEKTNVNPNFLFASHQYEDETKKFIGNWLKDGFWITRYRKEFINFKADVIAKGSFKNHPNMNKLVFNFSIGLASILGGTFVMLLIALALVRFVPNYVAILTPICFYAFMTILEFKKVKRRIEKYLLKESIN